MLEKVLRRMDYPNKVGFGRGLDEYRILDGPLNASLPGQVIHDTMCRRRQRM